MKAAPKKKVSRPLRIARTADVSLRVYDVLRARAIDYTLRPGDKINELELAAELGVSRTPIREALNRLISEGMMSFTPNRGFFRLPLDTAAIVDLYEARASIEIAAAQAACSRASDKDIDKLTAYYFSLVDKKNLWNMPIAEILKADEAFHESLVALSGNQEYVRIVKGINDRIRFVRSISVERIKDAIGSSGKKSDLRGDLRHHDVLLKALKERDAAACAAVLKQHITLGLDEAMALLKEGLSRIYLSKAH